MDLPSCTTSTLLERLLIPGHEEVWAVLDRRYRPILAAFSRRLGLSSQDSEEIAQEAIVRFLESYRDGRYDRTLGRLRTWIVGIARRCVIDLKRNQARRYGERGQSALDETPDQHTLEEIWDEEASRVVAERALQLLRDKSKLSPNTVRAFERVALAEQPVSEVAAELGMSIDSVYAAKHRCTSTLRSFVEELTLLYEGPG